MSEITGAGNLNIKKKPCGWAGGSCRHTVIKSTLQQNGKVNREDGSIRGWARPNCYFDKPNKPKNKDKDGNFLSYVEVPERYGKNKRYMEDYLLQRHHVIPCAVLTNIPELKENLKSLGWDINDQDNNGICLPSYDEGIFWHDLPKHHGYPAAHANYNAIVQEELEEEWATWVDLCKENNERELLEHIQVYVDATRNLIIQWDSSVFLVNENGGDRRASFINAGYKLTPSISQLKSRQYEGNEYDF